MVSYKDVNKIARKHKKNNLKYDLKSFLKIIFFLLIIALIKLDDSFIEKTPK